MVIFHGYVSLPEGTTLDPPIRAINSRPSDTIEFILRCSAIQLLGLPPARFMGRMNIFENKDGLLHKSFALFYA